MDVSNAFEKNLFCSAFEQLKEMCYYVTKFVIKYIYLPNISYQQKLWDSFNEKLIY